MRPEPAAFAALLALQLLFTPALRADDEAPPQAATAWNLADDWPTFKGDNARSGRGPALGLPISVLWTDHLKGQLYSSPVVQNGLVVLGSSAKRVYGIDLDSGAQRWMQALPDRVWGSAPALYQGRAYVGCVDGCVYSLSQADGSLGASYCGGSDVPHSDGDVLSPMLVDGGHLVFGSDDHFIYGFDLRSLVHWSLRTGGILHDNGAAEEAGLVVFPSHDSDVYGIGLSDGQLRWNYRARDAFNTVPAMDTERAYLGCADGRLYALTLTDGGVAWTFATSKGIMSSPALAADGSLVFGSADGSVYCLTAKTGDLRWRFKTKDYVLASPLVSGGLVWVGSFDGNLYVLDLKTGAKLWSMQIPGGVFAAPAESAGRVLVAGRRGTLVCLQAAAAP
ncbi:MAG TPA: PQQ-binding-like beta-propeller repeat protein [bacterium]|jgi:outer membrane protein assembly factor BamB|nr:PQQ-binding-like beta-propeller repeat protein [bacterium]